MFCILLAGLIKFVTMMIFVKLAPVIRMKEGAKRILSKPVIKKEPITPHMLQKLYKCLVKMIKNLIDLRFVLMCLLGYFGIPEIF